jgi:hypothetical protein
VPGARNSSSATGERRYSRSPVDNVIISNPLHFRRLPRDWKLLARSRYLEGDRWRSEIELSPRGGTGFLWPSPVRSCCMNGCWCLRAPAWQDRSQAARSRSRIFEKPFWGGGPWPSQAEHATGVPFQAVGRLDHDGNTSRISAIWSAVRKRVARPCSRRWSLAVSSNSSTAEAAADRELPATTGP